MTCFLFIVFFAPSKEVLLVGQILLGFEWGIVSGDLPPRKQAANFAVRNNFSCIRLRSPSCQAESLHDQLDEHVLHYRSIYQLWSSSRIRQPQRSMGISYSLRAPMGLADLLDSTRLFRT